MVRAYAAAFALFCGAAVVGAASTASAADHTVLYTFQGSDGDAPTGNLVSVGTMLYGTTQSGGLYNGETVFSLDLQTGTETVVHSFGAASDGSQPASLIRVGMRLYGTTFRGGAADCSSIFGPGCGTVFALDLATGTEHVVYSFRNRAGSDGALPTSVVALGRMLYGTTDFGGTSGAGTVFSLDTATRAEAILHHFSDYPDGSSPLGMLVNVGGTLYGTTLDGGRRDGGTVFSINPETGAVTVVHSFPGNCEDVCKGHHDGSAPASGLVELGGTLYGTTQDGGRYQPNCGVIGCGTVFSLDPSTGVEAVVHSFHGNSHVETPGTSLVKLGSRLYGTAHGGAFGQGTVFWVNPFTDAEKIAYSFQGGTDGGDPGETGLINVGGILYGATSGGGNAACGGFGTGCGTVFAIRP